MRCVFDRKLKVLTQLEIVKVCNGSKGFPAHTLLFPLLYSVKEGAKKPQSHYIHTCCLINVTVSAAALFLHIHSHFLRYSQ